MTNNNEKLAVATLEKIDDLCAAFEAAWQRGQPPVIESIVDQFSGNLLEKSALFRELLVLEVDYRKKSGQSPTSDEYLQRFGQFEELIHDAFRGDSTEAARHRFVPPTVQRMSELFPALEVLELIGAGGMGAVYKARQRGLDRLVAIKILPDEISHETKFALRFTREARALARLNHPNIVSVFEFGNANGTYFFLMEFVDGSNLREVIRSHSLTPTQALAIVPHLCDALQYAHDMGVVHRDIKPENILLDKSGKIKVADFGLSRLIGGEMQDIGLTGTNQVMGTFRYMAPEQMESSHTVDHRADIYSLGVVFYEMLTGELPIGRFAAPSEKVQVDVRLDEVVLRTLEREPQRRYQHASQVKTDLQLISNSPAVLAAPAQAPVQTPLGNHTKLATQEMSARLLVYRRQLMGEVAAALRPLMLGEVLQIVMGIGIVALGAWFWTSNTNVPHRMVSGIILHVYGVVTIIGGATVSVKIKSLDYSQPISKIRSAIETIRWCYLGFGVFVGFAWWLIWIPFSVALGFDAIILQPNAFWPSILIGVLGLVATWFLLWRGYSSSDLEKAGKWKEAMGGESIKNAFRKLDEMQEHSIE